jgi:hypothetical protein
MESHNQNQQPDDDDFNFKITLKLSTKLKEFIVTATKVGKVIIKIGNLLIPLLIIAGSIDPKQVAPHFPLPPESTNPNK